MFFGGLTLSSGTEKDSERSTLQAQEARVFIELRGCETSLHCAVEGVGKDQLLFRFTQIDPSDADREFSLAIDVSCKEYKGAFFSVLIGHDSAECWTVLISTPLLPNLPMLLHELNASRDIYGFIKQVRRSFVEWTDEHGSALPDGATDF
jgi:kinetochore protein Spc25